MAATTLKFGDSEVIVIVTHIYGGGAAFPNTIHFNGSFTKSAINMKNFGVHVSKNLEHNRLNIFKVKVVATTGDKPDMRNVFHAVLGTDKPIGVLFGWRLLSS